MRKPDTNNPGDTSWRSLTGSMLASTSALVLQFSWILFLYERQCKTGLVCWDLQIKKKLSVSKDYINGVAPKRKQNSLKVWSKNSIHA